MCMQKTSFRLVTRYAATLRRVAAATVLLVGASLAAAAAVPGAPGGGGPPPPPDPGVTITVTQLNWENDQGSVSIPYSKVGVATISFDSYGASLVSSSNGQFFNLEAVVSGQTRWSVQNLYLRYNSTAQALASHPSVQFLITNTPGTPVSQLQITYGLSSSMQVGIVKMPVIGITGTPAAPKTTKTAKATPLGVGVVGAPVVVPVTATNYHVGGLNGGGSGLTTYPTTVSDWTGPANPVTSIGYGETSVGMAGLPVVAEDVNGCAPGSVARSIQYMANNAGWTTPGVQNIYNSLYWYMGTTGSGTDDDDIVDGKNAYNAANELPITTASYWWNNANLGGLAGLLDDDGDVEILISWTNGGGHAAMVTSITLLSDGTYVITYIDDPDQGNNSTSNEEHVIYVDANGNFAGGSVIGFIAEQVKP
jgi:hypothetical protein